MLISEKDAKFDHPVCVVLVPTAEDKLIIDALHLVTIFDRVQHVRHKRRACSPVSPDVYGHVHLMRVTVRYLTLTLASMLALLEFF